MPYDMLASNHRALPQQGLFGLFEVIDSVFTGRNDADNTAEAWTVVVSGTTASQAYTLPSVVDDVTGDTLYAGEAHTVGVTDTTDALQAQSILEAWNLSEGRSYFSVSRSSATLTFTGTQLGRALTLSESDANLGTPSNTVNAAEAANIFPGRVVIRDNTAAQAQPTVKHPVAADFTAQVLSITFAGNTASYYSGTVLINGLIYSWGGVVWDTNLDTTCTAIAAKINGVMPANTVLAASVGSGGGVVTLTAEVVGSEFDATAAAVGHADAEATLAYTTGPSSATALRRRQKGIAAYSAGLPARETNGNIADTRPVYRANMPVKVVKRGIGFVQSAQTIANGDGVWVGTDTTDPGRVYNAGGALLVYLPPEQASFESDEISGNGQGIAKININFTP